MVHRGLPRRQAAAGRSRCCQDAVERRGRRNNQRHQLHDRLLQPAEKARPEAIEASLHCLAKWHAIMKRLLYYVSLPLSRSLFADVHKPSLFVKGVFFFSFNNNNNNNITINYPNIWELS
ncbi:hypothetical protein KSP40_PGU011306 [Platanthera guangdongensis]|uniref:Uncharacterized protein n=1 Tax=Platanthera guangdongensis TaxID=2320717 RepID=A0ABR2MI91_9ASPA